MDLEQLQELVDQLPVDIDATYPDRSPGDAHHQQLHDLHHGATREFVALVRQLRDGLVSPEEFAAAITAIGGHLADTDNPHATTAAQVGADPAGSAAAALAAAQEAVATATSMLLPQLLPPRSFDLSAALQGTYEPPTGFTARSALLFPQQSVANNSWAQRDILLPTARCHVDIHWTAAVDDVARGVRWRVLTAQTAAGGTYGALTDRASTEVTAPPQHQKAITRIATNINIGAGVHSFRIRRDAGHANDTLAANAIVTAVVITPVVA